jgi:hypothetical protein
MDIRKIIKIEELERMAVDPWFKDVISKITQFNQEDFSIFPFAVKNESIITWGRSLLFNEAIEAEDKTIDEVSISIIIQFHENNLQLLCDVALGAKLLYCSIKEDLDSFEKINPEFLDQFLNESRIGVLENSIRGINVMRSGSLNEL